MTLQDIPVEALGSEKATHTDIWWWLGGRKLHHVAPDVSRLVPRGCGNISTHQQTLSTFRSTEAKQQQGGDGQIVIKRFQTELIQPKKHTICI